MIAELNLGIAVAIFVMALFVARDQWADQQADARWRFVGLSVVVLASINLISAIPTPLGLIEYSDAFRFVAAMLRGVALVLLIAYALFRWERK